MACVLVAVCPLARAAELFLPSIYSDYMILQRDRPVPIWGWASPGEEVTVAFAGQQATAVSRSDGRWEATLSPLDAASGGRPLTIRASGGASRSFRDVVVGEVWILAGQSNMAWSVGQSAGADEAISRADYPWLRWFNQLPHEGADDAPARDAKGGRWQAVSPQIARQVSAAGFYFAEALKVSLEGVPIGLVNTSMGGTSIESWIDRDTLEALPAAQPGLDFYRKSLVSYDQRMVEWTQAKAEWELKAQKARAAGQALPPQDDFLRNGPLGPHHFRRPSALFYGKVAPVQPFAARGVIWYQGEANAANPTAARNYGPLLSTLIQRWREGWRDPDLFFLIVQLPGYEHPNRAADWPTLREQQAAVVAATPRSALAVTIDLGDKNDIHPTRKQPVGERLARLARRHVYGEVNAVAEGPRLLKAEAAGPELRLRFATTGALTTSAGTPPLALEWVGPDGIARPLSDATIEGTSIVASRPAREPFILRHAWSNWPTSNVQDASGLPLPPFQISVSP
jgi:sialate O-acetylesterase